MDKELIIKKMPLFKDELENKYQILKPQLMMYSMTVETTDILIPSYASLKQFISYAQSNIVSVFYYCRGFEIPPQLRLFSYITRIPCFVVTPSEQSLIYPAANIKPSKAMKLFKKIEKKKKEDLEDILPLYVVKILVSSP